MERIVSRIRALRILHDAACAQARYVSRSVSVVHDVLSVCTVVGTAVVALRSDYTGTAWSVVGAAVAMFGARLVEVFGDYEHRRRLHACAAAELETLENVVVRGDVYCDEISLRKIIAFRSLARSEQVPPLPSNSVDSRGEPQPSPPLDRAFQALDGITGGGYAFNVQRGAHGDSPTTTSCDIDSETATSGGSRTSSNRAQRIDMLCADRRRRDVASRILSNV